MRSQTLDLQSNLQTLARSGVSIEQAARAFKTTPNEAEAKAAKQALDALILAVVAGTATQDECDTLFAATLRDADLRSRVALSLPDENEDADIFAAVNGTDGTTGKGLE